MAESISEGTLKSWLKQPGDFVNADEEVATIETDKASTLSLSLVLRTQLASVRPEARLHTPDTTASLPPVTASANYCPHAYYRCLRGPGRQPATAQDRALKKKRNLFFERRLAKEVDQKKSPGFERAIQCNKQTVQSG